MGARGPPGGERGSASVEQVGLAALLALLLVAAIAAVAAGGDVDAGRDLAGALGRKIACAPRLPDACRHHPLVPAYGWPLARLARGARPGSRRRAAAPTACPLVPVDFRRCRQESCAVAAGPHLSASGAPDHRLHRDRGPPPRTSAGSRSPTGSTDPSIGWDARRRAARPRPTSKPPPARRSCSKDDPALVPLETLPGRDHYDFPAGERPPWQWSLRGIHNGWSS